ncbi:MAG: 2-C-methyl-D-erythritol 2,4-cyclodiphosphate synthase [Rhabdochlamydiaceae bacterium]
MMIAPKVRVGIGQDSHRFLSYEQTKPCVIGGLIFEDEAGLSADSDGDVVLHALCNAITSLTGIQILSGLVQDLYTKDGITDSQVYVEKALQILFPQTIQHVAFTIEGKRPVLSNRIDEMRSKIADILKIQISQVGISCSSGDGLSDVACGDGLQCFCVLTTIEI